jgi:hypothetical protein
MKRELMDVVVKKMKEVSIYFATTTKLVIGPNDRMQFYVENKSDTFFSGT